MWQLTDRNIFIVLKGEIRRLVLYKQDLTEPKEDRGEKMKIKKMRPVTLKKKKTNTQKNEIKETKKGEGFKKRIVSNINYYRI